MSQPVLLDLGGKARRLRYDWTALSDIKQRLKLQSVTDVLSQPLDYDVLTVILWAGLTHEDDELTERQVGRWVDGSNFEVVSEAMAQALAGAFPEGNGNPTKAVPRRRTGTRSSPTSKGPVPHSD